MSVPTTPAGDPVHHAMRLPVRKTDAGPDLGRAALGWTAVLASITYFVSDVIEAVNGGFSDAQLSLTLLAEAAVPFVVVGLYRVQRPRIGLVGKWAAFLYAYTYVYFTGTVLYALVHNTPDFESLTRDLDPAMTVHGAAMIAAGVALGFATATAGVLPRWTGTALGAGAVLVPLTVGLPVAIELLAVAIRDVAFIGMGTALLRSQPAGEDGAGPLRSTDETLERHSGTRFRGSPSTRDDSVARRGADWVSEASESGR
jgi:hypothetical protein